MGEYLKVSHFPDKWCINGIYQRSSSSIGFEGIPNLLQIYTYMDNPTIALLQIREGNYEKWVMVRSDNFGIMAETQRIHVKKKGKIGNFKWKVPPRGGALRGQHHLIPVKIQKVAFKPPPWPPNLAPKVLRVSGFKFGQYVLLNDDYILQGNKGHRGSPLYRSSNKMYLFARCFDRKCQWILGTEEEKDFIEQFNPMCSSKIVPIGTMPNHAFPFKIRKENNHLIEVDGIKITEPENRNKSTKSVRKYRKINRELLLKEVGYREQLQQYNEELTKLEDYRDSLKLQKIKWERAVQTTLERLNTARKEHLSSLRDREEYLQHLQDLIKKIEQQKQSIAKITMAHRKEDQKLENFWTNTERKAKAKNLIFSKIYLCRIKKDQR